MAELPSIDNLIVILQKCRKKKNLAYAKRVHAEICNIGLESHRAVENYIVPIFVECGSVHDALQVFNRLVHRNVYSWTSIIVGYIECGKPQHALNLYQKMQVDSVHPTSHTFMAVLKACAGMKDLDRGREIHVDILQNGLDKNVYVGSTLVNMYAKCGSLAEAREVFDKLPVRNVVSWNTLIAGYTEYGPGKEALKCLEQMQLEGISPDPVTSVCILKVCGSIGVIDKGREMHAGITQNGLESDVFVGNALVDMYAKCGSLLEARGVFDKLPVRDVVSWNALISGYAEHGPGQEALDCLEQMQLEGISPYVVTFVGVLKACSRICAIDKGRELHADIARKGLEKDVFVCNTLVDMYAKCGSLSEAQEVFDKLEVPDVVSWNALITGYAEHGPAEGALQCFEKMQLEGVSPDAVTFVSVLKACSSTGAIEKGREMHADIAHKGFERDVFVGNTLVDMYAKCGSLVEARGVFDNLPLRDVVSWNALIAGYAEHGPSEEALKCFELMQLDGISSNAVTYVCVLKACGNVGAIERGREMHADIALKGFQVDVFVGNSLVDMYAKCGSLLEAREAFHKMPIRDVVSWNALIAGYAEHGPSQGALQCFQQMELQGVSPDAATCVSVLKACGNLGAIDKGREMHAYITQKGFEKDVSVGNSLVVMYAKCGKPVEAQEVFDKLPVQNVVSWTAMVRGYGMNHESDMAVKCFEKMQKQGVKPDNITFTCLLTACSRAGLVLKGQEIFNVMREDYGIAPTINHYICIVDLLAKSGHLNEAGNFTELMGCPSFWTALLSGCKNYGEVELGLICFQQLVQMNPECASPYVLMAKIYAIAGQWDDAYRIEELRKQAGAKKKAACALIEVNNEVHEFVVGNNQSEDISAMLESLSSRMKEEGHVPSVNLVLMPNSADDLTL